MELEPPAAVAAEKRLPMQASWQPDGAAQLVLVSALDISGITIRGLRLRGRAWRERPDEAVMFQLEWLNPGAKFRPLWRLEWRPIGIHQNKAKGPSELHFLRINGSHHHPFELNWSNSEGRMRAGNLDVAVPLQPDPPSYEAFLELVGRTLRITNVGEIRSPPWESRLL